MATPKALMRPMEGGDQSLSYSRNSKLQMDFFRAAAPSLENALATCPLPVGTPALHVADLGCSTGSNTINQIVTVVTALRKRFSDFPEVFAFFSDLPGNDFNHIFQLLFIEKSSMAEGVSQIRHEFFPAAVPGSFYGRLFPSNSLHVVLCSNSIHWLSVDPCASPSKTLNPQNPKIEDGGVANPGTVWYTRAESPRVGAAYKAQAQRDLQTFLCCRAAEMLPGGLLWVMTPCMKHDDGHEEGSWFVELLDSAWRELITAGRLPPASIDSFNLPIYFRSLEDFEEAVEATGGVFSVLSMEEVNAKSELLERLDDDAEDAGWLRDRVLGSLRAVIDPMVREAQGEEVVQKLAKKLRETVMETSKKQKFGGYNAQQIQACIALVRK